MRGARRNTEVVKSYAEVQESLERFRRRDHDAVGELGRTVVLDHGRRMKRSTVLFHGLTASPRQFINIARSLYDRGHNVFVPRLPRHGYSDRLTNAPASLNAQQIKACALDSLDIARGLGDEVCVAGFSLGGLMAAYLGQFNELKRVVAVVPFLGVVLIPSAFRLQLAKWVLDRPNRFLWWDPVSREKQMPGHGYPRYPSHGVAHGLNLAEELAAAAARQAPKAEDLVVVLNAREPAVSNRAIMGLVRQWKLHKPDAVRVRRLTGLPFYHDIIEPKRYPLVAARVAPLLVDLIDE